MRSEELHLLNELLQRDFPVIYDLIGGIEGLLMCADKGGRRIVDIVNDRELFYESLSGETYNLLSEIAETETHWSGNGFLTEGLDKEFTSWDFTQALLMATDQYMSILKDELRPVLQKREHRVTVTHIAQSPLRAVYYVQIETD